jgi:predicted transcriptional regulator
MDSGSILDILGNDTRRRILAALSREPMYFNQLAKEIDIGQQAILRHLHSLEESGLVETYVKKSDLGAPDRKYYRLNSSFVLTVLLSEDDFKITNQEIAELRHKESQIWRSSLMTFVQLGSLFCTSCMKSVKTILSRRSEGCSTL